MRSSDDITRFRKARRCYVAHPRNAKIEHLYSNTGRRCIHDDVVRLDVSMNDVFLVGRLKRRTHLRYDLDRHFWSKRPVLPEHVANALSFNKLHREINDSLARDSEIVDRDGIRVFQSCRRLSLAPKALDALSI